MKFKTYELVTDYNSDGIFWIDEGKLYHHLDKLHPFPYFKESSRKIWNPETTVYKWNNKYQETEGLAALTIPLQKLRILFFAYEDSIENVLKVQKRELIKNHHNNYTEGLNLILVHYTFENILMLGSAFVPAITDFPVNYLD